MIARSGSDCTGSGTGLDSASIDRLARAMATRGARGQAPTPDGARWCDAMKCRHHGGTHPDLSSRARAADRFWAALRGGAATIEPVGVVDLEAAFAIGAAFPDQDFSIVDRTSFAVMERLGIHRVAAFDDNFAIYRYGPRRDRAFEVLR
jgi:hypothetical protein